MGIEVTGISDFEDQSLEHSRQVIDLQHSCP